jgi:all-trans-retinol 13,14-reductase
VHVLCGDAAEKIIVEQKRVSGVGLCSGETIPCDKLVAAIHPKLVLAMLPEETLPRDYRMGLLALPETSGAVVVHTLLPCHRHPPPGFNIFRIRHDKAMHVDGVFLQLRESHVPGYSHLTLIGGSSYRDWQRWHHTRSGARGPGYVAAKEEAAARMLEVAATVLGPLDGRLPVDISTPLTLRDWAASPQGSLYGLERSVPSDLRYTVLTRMPVRSMVLVGQNAIAPGLLGVTFGVLRGVGEVVGRAKFRDFLAKNLNDHHW